jgi:DNA gyrase subunit A
MLSHYIEHRRVVITRRSQFELKQAQDRLHILEGLRIALQNIDAIIELIKRSASPDEARNGLQTQYGLSEKQSNAILEMRLQRLTGLERDKIESEYHDILSKIKDLQDILSNTSRVFQIIKDEHLLLKEKFGDERRSEIGARVDGIDLEDLIPEENVAVLISKKGFIKRMPVSLFRSQNRGGRGVNSMTTQEEDIVEQLIISSTHDYFLAFTNQGRVFKLKVYQIPEVSRQSKGMSISHFLSLEDQEFVTAAVTVNAFTDTEYLFMTTQKGIVKKTQLDAFIHFKNRPIAAINLDEGDSLRWVTKTNGKQDIILVTSAGMVIRFDEDQARPLGRASRGVKGIRIKPEDRLVSMAAISPEEKQLHLLLITTNGYGKNVKVDEFKCQARGGVGVKSLRFRKTVPGDHVVDAITCSKENDMMIVSRDGTLCRQKIGAVSTQKRSSQGVKIAKLDAGDTVIAISEIDNAAFEDIQAAPEPSIIQTEIPITE